MSRPGVGVSNPILLEWYALAVLVGLAKHLGGAWGHVIRGHFAEFVASPTPEAWSIASALVERDDDPYWPSRLIIFPDPHSVWHEDPEGSRIIDGSSVEIEQTTISYAFITDK
jgi:hypothetical protein